jgi:hypothetical protein
MKEDLKYIKIIENSPLIFKIKDVSLKFFDVWKIAMQSKYPDILFDSKAKILATDMIHSFAESLKALFMEEKEETRIFPKWLKWSEGFILGFVASSLTSQWVNEYIYMKTAEYKQLMFLKAIILYFDVDKATMFRINQLYKYLINDEIDILKNVSDKQTKSSKIIHFKKFKNQKLKLEDRENFDQLLSKYLESIMIEKHHLVFNKLLEYNHLPKLNDFFSYDEITELINFYINITK